MAGWNALANLIARPNPIRPNQMGSGLLGQAAKSMSSDADYQAYVIDANEKGQDVMPREQWMKLQGNG
ncbi:MAG: hypothetical protein PHE88_11640 [Elusimicrobia bacterium]|nr:hypothetical protein [Elusimicrobiota bacterium]